MQLDEKAQLARAELAEKLRTILLEHPFDVALDAMLANIGIAIAGAENHRGLLKAAASTMRKWYFRGLQIKHEARATK